jgi:peptidoglycan/xylan/chitin deacetylase (PgdA/CDA1 family)
MSDVLVLCYHAVSPTWPAALSTTPERFASQLRILRRRGYKGVTFAEALGEPIRGKVVAVTFDDAYRNVGALAKPILDELGWPGTVFVPTDYPASGRPMAWPGIDNWMGGEYEHELRPLSWDELRDLAAAGWEIGSHTCSHPHLTALGDVELDRELRVSKEICEREIGPCRSIAYPYGDVDPRVVKATIQAGYTFGAGLPNRFHQPRAYEWPRIGVYHVDDDRRFQLKASRLVRGFRRRLLRDRPAAERA